MTISLVEVITDVMATSMATRAATWMRTEPKRVTANPNETSTAALKRPFTPKSSEPVARARNLKQRLPLVPSLSIQTKKPRWTECSGATFGGHAAGRHLTTSRVAFNTA